MKAPITLDTFPDRSVTQVSIPVVGNGTDSKSNAALNAWQPDAGTWRGPEGLLEAITQLV